MAERRNSYTSAFKLRLIKSAEGSDNSKVARKYNIDGSPLATGKRQIGVLD